MIATNMPPVEVPPEVRTLVGLNAEWRYVHHGQTLQKDKATGEWEPVKPSSCTVEVFDKTTKELYVKANAPTAEEALKLAADKARTAPKPKTLAQKADEALPLDEQIALHEARLDELRKQQTAAASSTVRPGVRTSGGKQ